MKNVDSMTRDELRAEAKELEIPGRGRMTAAELRQAVDEWRQVETAHAGLSKPTVEKVAETLPIPTERVTVHTHGSPHSVSVLAPRDRYRDRVARGGLVVATPNGAPPAIFAK